MGAFQKQRGNECSERWLKIPNDLHILITHTPPNGFCDECSSGLRAGCADLGRAIKQRAIPVNVFGHIHNGYGYAHDGVTTYINASTCTSDYRPTNPPIVFDAPPSSELIFETQKAACLKASSMYSGEDV